MVIGGTTDDEAPGIAAVRAVAKPPPGIRDHGLAFFFSSPGLR